MRRPPRTIGTGSPHHRTPRGAPMAPISAVSTSSEAQAALVKYQQKLATDLAAKAAAKVITADKEAVAKAQQAVQQAQQPSEVTTGASTAATADAIGATLDVTA